MPAQRLNFFRDVPDDIDRRGFTGNVRQEGKAHAAHTGSIEAAKLLHGHVLVEAGDAGRPSIHVLERIDDNVVVRAVTRGLHDNETPEPHFVDQNLFLFLPRRRIGLIF